MRRLILLFAALLLSTPLLASHCPADMARIDQILKTNPPSDPAVLAKVKELRTEGEQMHKHGDHSGSVKALGEALNLLGAK